MDHYTMRCADQRIGYIRVSCIIRYSESELVELLYQVAEQKREKTENGIQ